MLLRCVFCVLVTLKYCTCLCLSFVSSCLRLLSCFAWKEYAISCITAHFHAIRLLSLSTPLQNHSLLNPLPKLPLNMLLQPRKLIPESLATPPALHLPTRPISRTKPCTSLLKRKLLQLNEEACSKAVVVLPVLQVCAVHVSAEDVDVEMVHGGVCVHADFYLGEVVAALGHVGW